jgi:glycosyltransferase involved in cell wall biosynthesis
VTRHALFVHDNRTPGGVGHVSAQLCEGLQERGWSIDHLDLATRTGVWDAFRKLRRLRGVVLATQNFSAAYVAGAIGTLCGRPWVVWVHSPVTRVVRLAGSSTPKQALMRFTYRHAPVIVGCSRECLDALDSFCGSASPGQRRAVIRNTARPAFFRTDGASRLPGMPRVGFMGRLSPQKRPQAIIDALAFVPTEYELEMVGAGPLQPILTVQGGEQLAKGRLRFCGHEEVGPDTFRRWSATLLASEYEGYPLVLLESLASGVPVVSTPIAPAIEMLAHRAPYMLAGDDSPQSIADAVQSLLARDPAQVARDIAAINADHDPRAFITAWDELLTECLQR